MTGNQLEQFVDVHPAPGRVVFRDGCLGSTRELTAPLGDSALVIARPSNRKRLPIRYGCLETRELEFPGECTAEAVEKLCCQAEKSGTDFVVGQGGGKCLDTAKRVAWELRRPMVAVPTSAATCAAFTALAVEYGPGGNFLRYHYLSKPPDLLLLDPALVARAPRRLLAAGVADTAAKWVETVSSAGREPSTWLGRHSLALAADALTICEQALDRETEDSEACTRELIYANVLLSGLSSGIGGMTAHATIAHALCNAFTRLPAVRHPLHGEAIAFALMIQLVLEAFFAGEQDRLRRMFRRLGLPVTLTGFEAMLGRTMGLADWQSVHAHAVSEDETALLSPVRFTAQDLWEIARDLRDDTDKFQ